MKKKHDRNSLLLEQTQRTYDLMSSVISNNDCTGLAPAGMKEDEQAEGFKEIYYMNPPKTPDRTDTHIRNKKSK